jgi:hypothetical protein
VRLSRSSNLHSIITMQIFHGAIANLFVGGDEMNIVNPADVAPDTPLRLEVAAKLAFPDGSISVNSLRREIAAGRLEAMRIAGKHYVTLRGIGELAIAQSRFL